MHYPKVYFKKKMKKAFCLLMAAAMLSSGIELPANAAATVECAEELLEETETETLVEEVLEEVPEATARTIDAEETDSEIEAAETTAATEEGITTAQTIGTEEAEIELEEDTTFVEEIIDTEEQTNGLTIERPSDGSGGLEVKPIIGGELQEGIGSWSLNADGRLVVRGSGEFLERRSDGMLAAPWHEHRDKIKTAVVSLTGTTLFLDCFYGCKNLTSVDLSNTNTSRATDMSRMFAECESLEKINLSSFNTTNVKDMYKMFYLCKNLKEITFGKDFKTTNVKDMQQMFYKIGAASLDLSGFDMGNVTKADDMIYSDNLIELKTPRNLNLSIPLRGTWVTDEGHICPELLRHTDKSVHLKQRPKLVVEKRKTEYFVGDTLDLSDLTVSLLYNGSVTDHKITTDYTTNAAQIDMNTAGTKYLVISYQGQSVTINLTVIGKSLYVSKRKKEYFVGDTLNVDDLSVELLYTNNIYPSKKITSGYSTNAASINMKTAGTKDLIVKWQDLSATVKITVRADSCSKISVRNDKDTYYLGETLDLSELHVFAWSVSGTHTEITDYTTNAKDIDMNTVGTKQLIVSYQNFTAVSDITVKPARICTEISFQHGNVFETGQKPASDEYLYFSFMEDQKERTIGTCHYWSNIDEIDNTTPGKKQLQVAYEEMKGELDIYYIEAFREDDIAHGNHHFLYKDIAYKIDKNGNLKVMGKGACQTGNGTPIWLMERNYAKDIKTATLYVDEAQYLDRLFSGCVNLRSADLSMLDAGKATNMFNTFKDCNQLVLIHTPKNVKVSAELPNVEGTYWHDKNGKVYTTLPKNMSTSIVLTRAQIQEEESSAAVESSKVQESSSIKESSSVIESSKVEESSSMKESFNVEESSAAVEDPTVQESSEVSENTPSEEYSEVEESASTIESSKTEESTSVINSSETTENVSEPESTETNESSSENESGRTDLNKAGGTLSSVKAKIYDQNEYEPAVKVTIVENRKKITLTEGADYEIEYQSNVNAGTGTVLVKGNGNYKGTLKTTFTISQKSVKKLKILTGSMTTGLKSEPPVYVYDGATLLKNGTDYKLTYDSTLTAKAAKSAKITVTGLGNYKDSKTVKLAVYDVDEAHIINPQHVTLKQPGMEYTGKALQPVPAVKIGNTTLTANKDFKVRYQNNINAGTAYVIVTGKGAYKGEVIKTFEITALKANKTKLTIAPISDKIYNGQLQKPSVTVKAGTKKLTKNKDYTVTYAGNLHASTAGKKAKVIITGKGNYAGITATATFTILPQKISKASIKGSIKNLSVTYSKKQLKEGVQYKIIPDASGMKNNKTKVTITGLGDFSGSSVTKTIKIQ